MSNISIKKDFVDGQKLFAQQLNNNFETIEKGVNAGNKIIWKDDNGAEIQSFRGTTEEVNARPIIDGQTLYNIETGETALDVGDKRVSTGAGNVVYIGDEEPQNEATKIWIENDQVLNLGSEVVISSEEPITQEKVWIQKGKNLIEYYSIGHVNGLTGELDTDANWNHSQLIKVRPGEKYTFSIESTEAQQWLLAYYKEDGSFISMDYGDFSSGYNFIVKNMPSNCHKVYVGWRADRNYSKVQLEQGSAATPYEPYTPKKIHTKTDNGYEEFYNEEGHNKVNYSTSEQIIGTYLGKPLYRKVLQGVLDGTYTENGLFYSWISLNVGHLGIVTDLRVSAPSSKTEGRVYTSSGGSSVINCCVSGTAVQVGASTDHFDNQTVANVIIEYTKTTD